MILKRINRHGRALAPIDLHPLHHGGDNLGRVYSQILFDVLLTNTPELFKRCGTFNPDLSDHHMIYGEMIEKVRKLRPKKITFRQTKNTNFELLNQELLNAPWHVGDKFSSVYDYWSGLFENVVNLHAPLKSKRVREKDIPYMTQEWKKA